MNILLTMVKNKVIYIYEIIANTFLWKGKEHAFQNITYKNSTVKKKRYRKAIVVAFLPCFLLCSSVGETFAVGFASKLARGAGKASGVGVCGVLGGLLGAAGKGGYGLVKEGLRGSWSGGKNGIQAGLGVSRAIIHSGCGGHRGRDCCQRVTLGMSKAVLAGGVLLGCTASGVLLGFVGKGGWGFLSHAPGGFWRGTKCGIQLGMNLKSWAEGRQQQPGGGGAQPPGLRRRLLLGLLALASGGAGFLSGFQPETHASSLVGMQTVLLEPSEQLSRGLRLLALRAHEQPLNATTSFDTVGTVGIKNRNLQGPSKNSKEIMQSLTAAVAPVRTFGSSDTYVSNLERKVRSSEAGLVTSIAPGVSFGIAYKHNKDDRKDFTGMQLSSGVGGVTSQATTDMLSAVMTLNPQHTGFTGHLATAYGWGKVKNNRSITHDGQVTNAKGNPNINLMGGLIQVGYTLKASKTVSVTPYVETMMSTVSWGPYQEHTGSIPCKISRNKDQVIEHSIGLRSAWKTSNNSQIQGWVAGVSGRRKTDSLNCTSKASPLAKYEVVVPMNRKEYTQVELGMFYSKALSSNIEVTLNGTVRLDKMKKVGTQSMGAQVSYTF